jgi:hypothetical protein
MYHHLNKLSQHHNLTVIEAFNNFKKDGPFQSQFRHECLTESGISAELYAGTIEFTEDEGLWEVHRRLGLPYATQWIHNKPHEFGVTAFFINEDGTDWQAKPEHPLTDSKGKEQKYQTPKNQGSRAYLPPIDTSTRTAIGTRYGCEMPPEGDRFWDWVESHPEIPIVLTEGGKKALSLLSQSYVAIALYGVHGGYRVKDALGERLIHPELIDDLKRFAVSGRTVVLAFDQDSALKTRHQVTIALSRLGQCLERSGCHVRIAQWDGSQGKGVDDFIVNQGITAWESAYNSAKSLVKTNILKRLEHRVTRKPDLHIGTEEFKTVAPALPRQGTLVLQGAKGTGKSEAIARLLETDPWLSLAPLRTVARDQATAWDGVMLQDGDRFGSQALGIDGKPVSGVSLCFPSLLSAQRLPGEILVLDETTAGLDFLLGSKLCNHLGMRPQLLEEFHRRVREARLVILADADITETAIRYIEEIRGERAYLVKSDRKPLGYRVNLLTGKKNQALAEFLSQVETIPDGKLIYLNSDSKQLIDTIATVLEEKGIKSLKITQETSGEALQRRLTESKGQILPELALMGFKVILSSPSITQGFSIQYQTDRIISRWGIYSGGSIPATAIAQAPDRIRSDVPLYLWVAERGSAYSKLGRALNEKAFLKEFKQLRNAAARLAADSLTPTAAAAVNGTDWESQNLKMLASIEVSRNLGMMALRDTVIAVLQLEGKQIEPFTPLTDVAEAKAIGRALTEVAGKLKESHAAKVATAATLTETEAKGLEKKSEQSDLSPDERLALEKYYLAIFYRLESITTMDVMSDRKGKTRQQVKNLEMILDEAKAQTITAESIERNGSTPQDWRKDVVQRWLIEQSGAGELIRSIWRGEIVQLTPEIVEPIYEFIQAHSKEFGIAFGWGGGQKLGAMQTIGILLTWVGFDRKAHRKRENDIVTRFYVIKIEKIDWLKALLKRRSRPDPHLQLEGINKTHGSPLNPLLSSTSIKNLENEIYEFEYDPLIEEGDRSFPAVA